MLKAWIRRQPQWQQVSGSTTSLIGDLRVRGIVGIKPDERVNRQDILNHATLLYDRVDGHAAGRDFKVLSPHQESLHSHNAASMIVKGIPGGFCAEVEPTTFATLIHR